jgi:quercetin dioxygenase-like cupin family protein
MDVKHYSDVPATEVEEGAVGVKIRWMIGEDDGAPHFAMRHFEMAPGGHTPHHAHPWEHEVFILTGRGQVVGPQGARPLEPGTVVFVPGNDEHHFEAAEDEGLTMICVVPTSKP